MRTVVNWLHFVSLIYRKQRLGCTALNNHSCELTTFRIFDISQTASKSGLTLLWRLWIDYISYLWYIANSIWPWMLFTWLVVNWLHFVSLIYRKQLFTHPKREHTGCELTTFRIFDISQTAPFAVYIFRSLLWIDYISYLWYIANSLGEYYNV